MKGNLNYNRYFPGGAIAMARNLYDGLVEYPDGKKHILRDFRY
jgi:ubiquinol-cytochrome c reductase cytochrome c1 subunit